MKLSHVVKVLRPFTIRHTHLVTIQHQGITFLDVDVVMEVWIF